jgi:hypothetical protein
MRSVRIVATGLSAAAMCSAVAGCGGSNSKSEVTSTVKTFLTAFADGNGVKACAQLTAQEASTAAKSTGSCSSAVHALSSDAGGSGAAKLRNAKITSVKITGKNAVATIAGATTQADLTEIGGRWYISGGIS